MFFGGQDGKHGKVMANIQWVDQHLIKCILNMTSTVFCRLRRNLGEVKRESKNSTALTHEESYYHKAPSPNVNLYRGMTKILTHLLQPNRYFTSP